MTAWILLLLGPALQAQTHVAGGVVSSREWRVKRGEVKEEEFIGDVRYRTGASVIRSDWALYKHEPGTWQLRGSVSVDRKLDSGDRAQAFGDKAFLDMKTKAGWMTADGLVSFSRAPAEGGEPDRGEARRLEWQGRDAGALIGDVRLWGPRFESWSDRADYDAASGEVKLTGGRPVLRKFAGWQPEDDWSGAIKADRTSAWRSRRRLSSEGSVVGWLEFEKIDGLGKGARR